jgi:hypothetical protein
MQVVVRKEYRPTSVEEDELGGEGRERRGGGEKRRTREDEEDEEGEEGEEERREREQCCSV